MKKSELIDKISTLLEERKKSIMLTSYQLSGLTRDQISGLTGYQLSGLTSDQLSWLTNNVLASIKERLESEGKND